MIPLKPILRKLFIAVFVFGMFIFLNQHSFFPKKLNRHFVIYDVDHESILHLNNIGTHKGADRIDILVEGTLDGKAQIYQVIGKDRVDIHTIGPGKVSQRMGGPWHSNIFAFKYEPMDVKTGQLEIKYNFKD